MFENIEVVDFYEEKKEKYKDFIGTLHVYVPDFDLDIRGIDVVLQGKNHFIRLPHRAALDKESGKIVRYPIVCFANIETYKAFILCVRKKCIDFLRQKTYVAKKYVYKKEDKKKPKHKKSP